MIIYNFQFGKVVHLLACRLLEGCCELLVTSWENLIGKLKISTKSHLFSFVSCWYLVIISIVSIIPIISPCCFGKRQGDCFFISIWLFYSYIFIYFYLYIRYAFFYILLSLVDFFRNERMRFWDFWDFWDFVFIYTENSKMYEMGVWDYWDYWNYWDFVSLRSSGL